MNNFWEIAFKVCLSLVIVAVIAETGTVRAVWRFFGGGISLVMFPCKHVLRTWQIM